MTGQLAAWKPRCEKALPFLDSQCRRLTFPQAPASQQVYVANCHAALHADREQTGVTGGLGSDLAINPGRNPVQPHLKLNIKITPIRHFDIIKIL